MEQKFLKKETKTFSVVTSVLIGIALMILVIVGLIGGNFLNFSLIGSSVIVFTSAIFMGAMQIRVFSNYKSQKKYLCAIWKILISVLGFKQKFYNAFAELIIAFFWLLSGIAVLLTTFEGLVDVGSYLLCVSNYLLGIATIFYILFSYVYKEPNFLVTEEAIAILQRENEERAQRINRFNTRYSIPVAESKEETKKENSIEQKLEKLKNLKEKGFITEEEYEKKKKALIDEEL